MPRAYDNWERLVAATLKRENLRQIALCSSFSSSYRSDDSRISFASPIIYHRLADVPERVVRRLLEKPITFPHILDKSISLADQVINAADFAILFKQECTELKSNTEKLASLLFLGAHAVNNRATRLLIMEVDVILYKVLALLLKCSAKGLKRVFTVIPSDAFRKITLLLQNSIGDVSWLLQFSAGGDYYIGLPPIFSNDPIVSFILEQIAILSMGSMEGRSNAAGILVILFRESDRYRELFIEDGGVLPLLNLMSEGELEGRENAARAISLLLNDPINVEQMIRVDVCLMFVKMLNSGPMKVRAMASWAISEFAAHYPKNQDLFAELEIIDVLINHLRSRGKYDDAISADVLTSTSNESSIVAVNDIEMGVNDEDVESHNSSPSRTMQPNLELNVVKGTMALKGTNCLIQNNHGQSNGNDVAKVNYLPLLLLGASYESQEMKDLAAEAYIKAMALRALSYLAKWNRTICLRIAKSRTLLSIACLLKNGPEEVLLTSVMAFMEITTLAASDAELKSAFNPDLLACKAVVDQLIIFINKARPELLIPCIKTLGNFAQNFMAEGTRMISHLVNLLDKGEAEVDSEACATLTKFICPENKLHQNYSKLIISAGGVQHLVQLVYFAEEIVKKRALAVVCYIALHVPDSEDIAQALTELKWAAKKAWLMEDEDVFTLFHIAEGRLSFINLEGTPLN